MGVSNVEDLAAYHFATEFKLEVYRLIRQSPGASKDFRYRGQLEEAVSGIEGTIGEGFGRRRPKEFALYLRYALGSLRESVTRLRDGIHKGYFVASKCSTAFTWAERCRTATAGLWRSQERRARSDDDRNRNGGRSKKRPRRIS